MVNRGKRAAFSIRRCLYATALIAVSMTFVRVTYPHWMSALPLFAFVTGGLILSAVGTLVGGRQSFISWGAVGAFGGFLVTPAYLIACEVPPFLAILLRHSSEILVVVMLYCGVLFTIVIVNCICRLIVSRRDDSQW